jgi:hypothetical protein
MMRASLGRNGHFLAFILGFSLLRWALLVRSVGLATHFYSMPHAFHSLYVQR